MFSKTIRKLLPMFSMFAIASVHCTTKHKTYLWGNGYYQARPDALLQFKNFTPKQITNLPDNLVKLSFGQFYEAGINSKGQLYVWETKALDSNISSENSDNTVKGLKKLDKDIQDVKFTKGYIWALSKNGNVYQYPIVRKIEENQIKGVQIGSKRQVQPLKGSKQLATGDDHVICLNDKGEVFAMGDDTLGQCGQCDTNRHTHPPFTQKRIKFPVKVQGLPKIVKITSGANHCLALDQNNVLYGWGSNSTLQLSHQQQFSAMTKPLLCTYTPLKISKNLDNNIIQDIEAGQQFTIIITKNRATQHCQVFSTGNNLRGQLAINQIRHLKDISKIQSLSNYIMKVKGQQKRVTIKQIACGYRHCLALLNIGYIMQWGDNQYGQMGNKKRAPVSSPIVARDFIDKQVVGVFAGVNSSGVIVVQNQQKQKK